MVRKDIDERLPEIMQWISEGKSIAYMSRELNCKHVTVTNHLKKNGIQYAGNQSGKGMKKNYTHILSLVEFLELHPNDAPTNSVKHKILKEGYKPHMCESCGLTEWQGNPIPLELHHVDGDRQNNCIENFQLLCPNCHALTDSYRGRNTNKYKENHK